MESELTAISQNGWSKGSSGGAHSPPQSRSGTAGGRKLKHIGTTGFSRVSAVNMDEAV